MIRKGRVHNVHRRLCSGDDAHFEQEGWREAETRMIRVPKARNPGHINSQFALRVPAASPIEKAFDRVVHSMKSSGGIVGIGVHVL